MAGDIHLKSLRDMQLFFAGYQELEMNNNLHNRR